MGSGKRASMREGPLANLFRKTETEGLQDPPQRRLARKSPRCPSGPRRRRRSVCAMRSRAKFPET